MKRNLSIVSPKKVARHRINKGNAKPIRIAGGGMLATLVVGGGVVVASQKDVTVDVDGKIISASTMSRNVEGALKAAGVELEEGVTVSPALDERISDDTKITIRTPRQVSLIVDGKVEEVSTKALTVGDLLKEIGRDSNDTSVSEAEDVKIPTEGMDLELVSSKKVTVTDNGKEREVNVPARNVGELLELIDAPLDEDDFSVPAAHTPVTDGLKVNVVRVEEQETTEERPIEVPVRVEEDPDMLIGEETVTEEGSEGKELVTVKTRVENGKETLREVINTKKITEATERVIVRGTKEETLVTNVAAESDDASAASGNTGAAAPAVADGSVWDQLAQCESGGNWHINTGNGFSGGLQFHPQTWTSLGGGEYAPEAWQASREQQIVIAERVRAAQGWGAWPACSAKLGLL